MRLSKLSASAFSVLAATSILFSAGAPAKANPDGNNDTQAQDNQLLSDIPVLLDRAPGLYEAEFKRIQANFQNLTTRLTTQADDAEAYIAIGQIYMREARITGEHPYYYPAALQILQHALTINPKSYEALVSLGSVQMSLHKFTDARASAHNAIQIAPKRAIAYGILCDASLELGDYRAAVNACDKMVNIRPDLRSYARVSYLREVHGDVPGAIAAMQMAVKAGLPGSEEAAWTQTMLGDLHLKTGNITEAQKNYYAAARQRANYPFALAGLARVQAALGNPEQATSLLDQAVALAPEFGFLQAKADMMRVAGHNQQADSLITVIEGMLAEDEAAGHAMDREIALMYSDHNLKMDEAAKRAAKELNKRPKNIDAQHTAAIVALQNGRIQDAKNHIEQAMRLGTADPVMTAHAGLIEARLGNRSAAKELLEQAVAANPYLPALLKQEVLSTLKELV